MFERRRVAAVLAAFAILLVGCNDSEGTATTEAVTSAEDVVFGQGELPATMPENFPLPTGSAIGSTMVITKTGFTEVVIRINAEQGVAAEYFNQALEQAGFSVDKSEADGSDWLIEFSDDNAKGMIKVSAPQESISQAVVTYNIP